MPVNSSIRRGLTPLLYLSVSLCEQKKGSVYGACRLMDFELEMGAFIGGSPNPLGTLHRPFHHPRPFHHSEPSHWVGYT